MKQLKNPAPAHAPGEQPPSKKFPDHAQTDATASREQVRDSVARVQAPRESKRPAERSGKAPSR